jgi:hypothetical protein
LRGLQRKDLSGGARPVETFSMRPALTQPHPGAIPYQQTQARAIAESLDIADARRPPAAVEQGRPPHRMPFQNNACAKIAKDWATCFS